MSKRKSKCGLHEEENTDKRGGGVYKPALSGFPQYMLSMLSDTDRNKQYEKAISKCVSDFIESVGRQPVVADMGCGTGLLTLISLASGAKFVIAVDTNSDMVDITERVTKNWQNVEVFHGTFESYTNKKNISEPFIDILVSEIFGTLHTSEGMPSYISGVSQYLKVFDGKVFCVPQSASTYANPVVAVDISSVPDVQKCYRQHLIKSEEGEYAAWVPTNELGMVVFNGPESSMKYVYHENRRVVLRTDSFKEVDCGKFVKNSKILNKEEFDLVWDEDAMVCSEFSVAMIVLEFEAVLWRDVYLRNTLESYSDTLRLYGSTVALSKYDAWGFFVATLDLPTHVSSARAKLKSYNSKGIPNLSISARLKNRKVFQSSVGDIATRSRRLTIELYRSFLPLPFSSCSSVLSFLLDGFGVILCVECPLSALLLAESLGNRAGVVALYDCDNSVRHLLSSVMERRGITNHKLVHARSSSRMGVDLDNVKVVVVDEIGLSRDLLVCYDADVLTQIDAMMRPFESCSSAKVWEYDDANAQNTVGYHEETILLANKRWGNVLQQIGDNTPVLPEVTRRHEVVYVDLGLLACSLSGHPQAVLAAYDGIIPQLKDGRCPGSLKTNFDADGAHWLLPGFLPAICSKIKGKRVVKGCVNSSASETASDGESTSERTLLLLFPLVLPSLSASMLSVSTADIEVVSFEKELAWNALFGCRIIDVTSYTLPGSICLDGSQIS